MFLACDVGNSLIKIGFFLDEKLIRLKKFSPDRIDDSIFSDYEISGAAVSSVNQKSALLLIDFLKRKSYATPFVIDITKKFNLQIDYKTPVSLGIDRLCGAEGAFYFFKKNKTGYSKNDFIISIDFGTATTVNLIRFNGVFAGGMISPGIEMMKQSLSSKTAQLPLVEFSEFKTVFGKSTKASIASGIINSTAGMINNAVNHLKKENISAQFHIFITGGNAEQILPFLEIKYIHQPNLLLYGIKEVYRKNL